MGWKGTVRSVQAALRQAERDARRRQRELERQRREYEKLAALERARLEVEEYENYVERLQTLHLDGASAVEWERFVSAKEPCPPIRTSSAEEAAVAKQEEYRPTLIAKLLGRDAKKRAALEEAVRNAPAEDELAYQHAVHDFEKQHQDWADARQFAERVLGLEAEALLDAVRELHPFTEAAELGSSLEFDMEDGLPMHAVLHVHGEDVVPKTAKRLLQSGRLSEKSLPKGQYYELYQDHVCSAVLRVARDLFAILPIEAVIVSAKDTLLNTGTGHLEEQAILSVAIPRKTVERLNFQLLDPSDSMENFVHRMDFKKTKGFQPVEPLSPKEVPLSDAR